MGASATKTRTKSLLVKQASGIIDEQGEAPPVAAIEAALSRGDVLTAMSMQGVEVRFFVCKWRQIEIFVEGRWASSLGSLQILDEAEDYVDLYDEEEPVLRLKKEDAERTLASLVRLCNRAAIPHDLVMSMPVMRCKYCNHVRNEHGVRTLCNVMHRMHEAKDYDSSGEGPVQDWMSATVLPPGCTQTDCDDTEGAADTHGWHCAACTFHNTGKRAARHCGVCGASRPVVPATPTSLVCLDCKITLANAPPFCSRTSRPHPLPRSHAATGKACGACSVAPSNTILMPCRHLASCSACAPSLQTCPRCDVPVTHRLEVYA
eukprot:TRINITY_DN27212_c0_g1_i1.p1 TRINITY_DN27212_c0_g1~~TRINITY_DN27212_c0_g1_i1.p1  ORF type:complete len:319 (+),score=45.19 TRINITY_DN27212_c0_g1_i1:44-1000(+)